MTQESNELSAPDARRRIVVGFDGSEPSVAALDWAIGEASHDSVVIDVVTAWTFPMVKGYSFSASVADVEKAARRLVDQALTHVADLDPDAVVRGEIYDDAAGPALVRASEGADVLVVGSRGLGGWRGLTLGSVSTYCARHAHCSVVIVR